MGAAGGSIEGDSWPCGFTGGCSADKYRNGFELDGSSSNLNCILGGAASVSKGLNVDEAFASAFNGTKGAAASTGAETKGKEIGAGAFGR